MAMDILFRMMRVNQVPFGVSRIKMNNAGLVVINPNNGVIVIRHDSPPVFISEDNLELAIADRVASGVGAAAYEDSRFLGLLSR
jgi:hypothetical protein